MVGSTISRCHGLTFDSELCLGEEPEKCRGKATVYLQQRCVPERLEPVLCAGACFQARANAYLLDVPNVGRYLVRDGRTIHVEVHSTPIAARHFLHGSPMAALLVQLGRIVFQGSAVRTRRGAVLFVGPPAAGKSVLASAFQNIGYAFMADDLCSITLGPPLLHPGAPYVCLWSGDATRLGLEAEGTPLRPGLDRFLFRTKQSDSSPVPVFAVCALSTWNEEMVRVEPLSGAARLHVLLASLYNRQVLDACYEPRHNLSKISALAQVPCFQIWRPRGSWCLEPLVSRLHEVLEL